MALTITKKNSVNAGHLFMNSYEVTFDTSYPTGGEALTAAQLGLNVIDAMVSTRTLTPLATTKTVVWDDTNRKLFISVEDGTSGVNAEASSASDQSAVVARITVLGH